MTCRRRRRSGVVHDSSSSSSGERIIDAQQATHYRTTTTAPMKPQQSSFEQTMLTLKTVGTAQEMQFRQATDALRACDDYEATLSAAQLALHRLCADPLLFASTRASVPGAGAAKLMAALGYRSAG